MTTTSTGLTKLACEFNLIDHTQGDQYLYIRVETEVPTVAGDWQDVSQAADVFNGLITEVVENGSEDFSLDEGFRYYVNEELLA